MISADEWTDLKNRVIECAENTNANRKILESLLEELESLLREVFSSNGEDLDEDQFMETLTQIEYISYSLSMLSNGWNFTSREVLRLFRATFDAICAFEDEELVSSFDQLLLILLVAAGKAEQNQYDKVLNQLLELVKYCDDSDSKLKCPPSILSPDAVTKISGDSRPFFSCHLPQVIIAALFGENSDSLVPSDVFRLFWPYCQSVLQDAHESEDTWIVEPCLKCALKALNAKREKESAVEQARFIGELLSLTLSSCKSQVLSDIFQTIQSFIEEHGKLMMLKKELRESVLEWLNTYLKLIGDETDELGVLETFTKWMVELTAHQEAQDAPPEACFTLIEICSRRIETGYQSSPACLHHYLDLLVSLFKLAKIQKIDSFKWITTEIQKQNIPDNPRWPRLLGSLLSVQQPIAQGLFKKFAPTVESLWAKIKNKELSAVNSLAIVLASCHFLGGADEAAKQIIPILLLPCFRDFRERVGVKWDQFRIAGAPKTGPAEIMDLEKYTLLHEPPNFEATKLRAVQCALQIEKKTGKYVALVADMSLAVFAVSQTDQIALCLPALVHFLTENPTFISDFVTVLIAKLAEKHAVYAEKTIREMCKTVRMLICLSANRKNKCSKCEKNSKTFVEPDTGDGLRLDERSLALFVKGAIEKRHEYADGIIPELLETCRVILLHVDSPRLPTHFTPIVKALDIAFSPHNDCFFRIWELISWKSEADDEKKLQIYIPVLGRALLSIRSNDPAKLTEFMWKVLDARLPTTVKVAVFAGVFAHSAVTDSEDVWNVTTAWTRPFARHLLPELADAPEDGLLQAMLKRYATIFTRSFVGRLLLDTTLDELRIRETARSFISRALILFRFANLIAVLPVIRPTLLYWTLIAGARGQCPKQVCSIVDFLCQELVVATNSTSQIPTNPIDIHVVKAQRKALITEMFKHLIQLWAFETCKGNESLWKFCADHCDFAESDQKVVACTFRKEIFERLLLVRPEDFLVPQNGSLVVQELQKTYENMKKGEKFNLATAMDTRSEGTEFLFSFRTYFTNDVHFWMRERAAASFRVVLQHGKPELLEANWMAILMTLRHSPPHLEATRLSWLQFVDQLNYSKLRTSIWRIITDVGRVPNNEEIVERIWKRLSYASDIDKIAADGMFTRFFWVIPLEVEKRIDVTFTIPKARRIDDVFEFLRQFSLFPCLQFVPNLSSKIDRGTVWKDDLPRLTGALTECLPLCESVQQRDQICALLQKVPISNTELADHNFVRWDPAATFFSDPIQLTQAVLDECCQVVETMSPVGRLEYADRTMCEVQKYLTEKGADHERRSTFEALKNVYAQMNNFRPDPQLIESKTFDELSGPFTTKTFARWLTVLIVKCAEMAGETPLTSLIPIAHIDDVRFLSKLAMRFILTVIHLGRDSVTQWILTVFEDALVAASRRNTTKSERGAATFIFYVYDFLYFYLNSEEVRRKKQVWERTMEFWKSMMQWTMKDEHGHEQPLIVNVAEVFGMEKRCILWLETFMEMKRRNGRTESETEASYYYTLMNLYAKIHELNGVRGAYAQLSKVQIDHVYGKICLHEAFGDVASATALSQMTGKGKPFDPEASIRKLINELNSVECIAHDKEEHEERVNSLKGLTQWMKLDKDIGPSPQLFARTIESRATESRILTMIRDGKEDEHVDKAIEAAREKALERLAECAIGGSCSYETATPFVVQVQQLDEISRLKSVTVENLVGFDSDFWKALQKRTDGGEQRMDLLEPILRVRRKMLEIRMKVLGDRDKDQIRSRIVEAHLQSARIARLTGCQERALVAIINAKKVLPFDNKIVLEEAKLRLQTSNEMSGMNLLNSILEKTFGELSKHYGDTQQSMNLDLQNQAKHKIEMFPTETKNLFSSVQMLRIAHMIKAGNTIGFEKIYNETTNLLKAFVSSGVMYEAAWLLDYLFHYNERNRHVLPLLKAYKEVAKYETNPVLQARAVERMMSLWLSNTRKISGLVASSRVSAAAASEMSGNVKTMNLEIKSAVDRIGWRAFYPAYAVLARHIDHQDDEVFRTIKHIMQQLIYRMPHQCMWQSVYLLRQDIAEIKKRYMEVLTGVKRRAPCYITLIDQYDYASAVFNQVSEKVDSDNCNLGEKVEGLKTLFREKKYDPKGLIMDRRMEGECKIISGIMVPIRSVIDGSVHAEEFGDVGHAESCVVPDRYLIHDFCDEVKVLHSKTKPVLIELITKEGRKVRLICKKEDDLTKDYHFTKMVEMCNDLLIKDEQTRIQNMTATTYSVIPLAKHGGIIEFMEGVTPFYETLDKLMGRTPSEWSSLVQKWAIRMKPMSKEERTAYFRNECCAQSPLVMAKWFRLQYPEAGKWFAARKLFAKSSAVMSMIGYIFGLGDRHTKNLMVHLPTGKCVHVDFDMIFNKGELLGTPEVVPFRLTRNMVNGMGEVALDGEFRTVCEQTLRVFRENSYEIEKYIADLPNLVSDFSLKDFDMTEAKRLISGRLRGQIMTAKLYRSNPISHPMQVSQLASSLIELATSDEKLSEMFEGWMPFL
ncbi:unnamed protein product [Caenorhabditis sp. 36 PRJEB53466]|nr:unnamed protein product [Caenorhabditis sp. 36 PRJEB53466]